MSAAWFGSSEENRPLPIDGNPMNPEQIGKLLKALIADHYARGDTELAESVSWRASNFREWVLRHALTQMLLRNDQLAAADSRRVPDQVILLGLPEYTERANAGALHIRMRLIARTGETTEFRIYATLSGGRCAVCASISSGASPTPCADTSVREERSTTIGHHSPLQLPSGAERLVRPPSARCERFDPCQSRIH